jgi:hypothetical protein
VNEVDRAEQRRQATEHLAEVMAGSTGTAEHPSRMAIATATATGELKWLRLHPHALGAGARAVGQLVVETARLATDAAVQRGYNELAKSLGDSMAIAIEGFAGPPPFRTAADAAGRAPYTDAPPPGAGFAGGPPQHHGGRPAFPASGPPTAFQGGGPPSTPGGQPTYGGAQSGGQPAYGGVQPAFRAEDQRSYGGTIEPPVEEQPAPPFAPTPQPGRKPRPPVDDDDDAYFADPFGTGGSRR